MVSSIIYGTALIINSIPEPLLSWVINTLVCLCHLLPATRPDTVVLPDASLHSYSDPENSHHLSLFLPCLKFSLLIETVPNVLIASLTYSEEQNKFLSLNGLILRYTEILIPIK